MKRLLPGVDIWKRSFAVSKTQDTNFQDFGEKLHGQPVLQVCGTILFNITILNLVCFWAIWGSAQTSWKHTAGLDSGEWMSQSMCIDYHKSWIAIEASDWLHLCQLRTLKSYQVISPLVEVIAIYGNEYEQVNAETGLHFMKERAKYCCLGSTLASSALESSTSRYYKILHKVNTWWCYAMLWLLWDLTVTSLVS